MEAEIIAVGTELLGVQRVDTNSLFLTDQLNMLGVEVRRKMVVGDHRELLTASIREALDRVEIIILTGGLGPTEDDLTREAVAAATGRKLIFRDDLRDAIAARFRSFNRKMAEVNLRQAYLVEGAEPLENPNGTAAGQWLEHGSRVVMMLPGPPHEMKPMFTNHCVPRLERRLPARVIRTRFYRVAGIGESDLDQLIAPVYSKYENPVTTILAAPSDIQIHLRARCATAEEAEGLLAEVGTPIEALLGDRIYSRNGDPLESVIGQMLVVRQATLAVAESCTGGLLGQRVTSIAGSSKYFVGGFLVYSDAMKQQLVDVDARILAEHTSVSEEAARAMAEGARNRTGATYALSITGEAGPDSSTGATVGTVFVGFAGPDGCDARRLQLPGDRTRIRTFAAQAALDLLRRKIG
ncbi:MAG TPA: competence/damage-inducible protein A [Bryobacteraceae bacterium]|nr:competence/damage-inducible protein A [Bryobacteraceae bacterium]